MAKKKTDGGNGGLSFLNKFNTSVDKIKSVSGNTRYPDFFFDSGSCIINKIMSDRYDGGFAEGRMSMISGPSNSGKSFILGNVIKASQQKNYGVFVIDTEGALDDRYLSKIGVDVDAPNFIIKGISNIPDATKVTSEFFSAYASAPKEEQIPFLIAIDSLDFLMSKSQEEKYEKGEMSVDMGLRIKQLADMQANIMHAIKPFPIAVICTKDPYVNQDERTKLRQPYVITEKLRFAYSQILMITNTMSKDTTTNLYNGINLTAFGTKTRFAKPFQKCVVEVPYDEGMDWYTGILEAAVSLGIVDKNGSWYSFEDSKFQKNKFDDYKHEIYLRVVEHESETLSYEETSDDGESS